MRLSDLHIIPKLPSGLYINKELTIYFGLGLWENKFFNILPEGQITISLPLEWVRAKKELTTEQWNLLDCLILLCKNWNASLVDYKDFMETFEQIEKDFLK